MSNKDFGGKMMVKTSTGVVLSLRGTLNFNPSRYEIGSVVNQDLSVDRTATPKARQFEINFADRGIDLAGLMESDRFNITFTEDFTGVTHYFTDAFFEGDPQTNRMTGEVTGIKGSAEKYTRKGAA